MVLRRAFTCSKLSLPREESDVSGARNRGMGKDQNAKAMIGSSDE